MPRALPSIPAAAATRGQARTTTMNPYQDLINQVKSDCQALDELYENRLSINAQREVLTESREALSDELLDGATDSSDLVACEAQLHKIDTKLRALNRRIDSHEVAFHQLVPQACHTFQRLLQHYQRSVHERSVQDLQSLVHPNFRIGFAPQIEQLADATGASIAAHALQIPSGSSWAIARPLEPKSRSDTLQQVRATALALTDSAVQLLGELAKLGEIHALPEFVLGPLPEPISEPVPEPPPTFDESLWQSPQEREFIMQLCQEAGRDFKALTDADKLVLLNSLKLYRSQLQSVQRQGFTNWDGTQS